ncbi:MAG: hypothetical protein M0Z77_09545 [Thermoplasmatales archaeon]|jgi:hypothetical protein|nr:hypothetical protein [Thermoplasmatales archaeon]
MVEYDSDKSGNAMFKNDVFNSAFYDLFKSETYNVSELTSNGGPLFYILKEHSATMAKGGRGKFNPRNRYRDTTYFVHVLNMILISGRSLERYLLAKNHNLKDFEPYIRAFFVACVFHDANKLFGEETDMTPDLLHRHRADIEGMISGYIEDYEKFLPVIEALILGDENKSRGYVSLSGMDKDDSSNVRFLMKFITFGDVVSSILSENIEPYAIYEKVRDVCLSEEYRDFAGKVNMITLNNRPQTMLRNIVLYSIEAEMSEGTSNGRSILAVSPSSVLYFTEGVNLDDVFARASLRIEKFIEDSMEKIYGVYEPSGKNFQPTFLSWISDSGIDSYLGKFAHKFFMLEGVNNLLERNQDFVAQWNSKEFRISLDEKNKKLQMKPCPEGARGEDIGYCKLLSLFALERIRSILYKDKGSVTDKTLRSLEFASENVGKYDDVYPRLKQVCISKGKEEYPEKPEREGRKILDSFVSAPTTAERGMSKKESCLMCGAEGKLTFSDVYAFGFKATSGTGRKISENRYVEDYRICPLCATESELRKIEFGDISDSLTLHVSIGDYVHPLDYTTVKSITDATLKQIGTGIEIKGVPKSIDLYDKLSFAHEGDTRFHVFFDHHHLAFLPDSWGNLRGGDTYPKFLYINYLLHFIKATGFKVRVSPLTSGAKLFEQTFLWENAPSWVAPMGLSEVRLDEIEDRLDDLDTIKKVVDLDGGDESSTLRVVFSLSRSRFSIYRLVFESLKKRNLRSISSDLYSAIRNYAQKNANGENMGTNGVENIGKANNRSDVKGIDDLVKSALEIMAKAPEGFYEDERLVREAFDTIDRHRKEPDSEIAIYIRGNIATVAKRSNDEYLRHGGDLTGSQQASIANFAETFVKFYNERRDKMSSPYRKDVISAFAIEYHFQKWNLVNERKEKKEGREALEGGDKVEQ